MAQQSADDAAGEAGPENAESAPASGPLDRLRENLRELYYGNTPRARRVRMALLVLDVVLIIYFLATATFELSPVWHAVDYVIGAALVLDYLARMLIANRPWRFMLSFTAIMDLIVIVSLFASAFIDNLGFLRVVRMLRLLRSYHVVNDMRRYSKWFIRNEEVIQSALNLTVFVFLVTAVVFVLEDGRNPQINNYFDALYFTVATLTTTGFGDITLTDTAGRVLAVLIMVFGVGLFLRLVQTIFRPAKVSYPCPECGLSRHDPDAVHCKHCGETLNIPTEGDW
ncbi:potassium channel family protein [Amorphus orientalis]|uniref:Voltage-gated potassium channel n=1 Tax=Amorphus orientalis TaxID=649198 RepID=A0AAE3VRY4_9HYPH|nr:potassium channel family protein [Amorphus orientalis]MDQ0317105.1 voltage-gated potassium channel [Amorphus orientalis]